MNNKKRLIAIIAGLTMSAASIAGLSACNNSQHQHSWKEEWTPSATEHWHDPACDDTTEVKDKGAHVWDKGTVVTEATHTTPGQKKYTCETCGYEKTESIPASGHTYSDELDHDDNFHWKVPNCDCENLTEAELKKDKAEHVLVPVVDEQPTDTKNGKQHYECSTKGCDYETKQETLYNYIGEKLSGGDKVSVGNVENDTTVIAEQDKNSNAWTGAVKLTKLNAASKTFVYDLHVSGTYAGTWVDAWAWQRFGIQVTENTGFYIWNNTNGGSNSVCIRKFTADNKTNCEKECQEEVLVSGNAAEAAYGWITGAVFGEDGADIRISRVNDKLNLYVKNADGYQYIGTVTCGDEANEFALYGVTAEYTFSDFEVTALTHVDEKAPSATEKGYFEHYYTGADESKVYYDANGKLTTWDKLERPAVLETVEITLQTKKDGQTAAFSGATVKVDGEDVAVTGGKITLENIEPNTEIIITAGDYTGKLKVTAAAESVVLEYNYATATGKVDLSHMNDAGHAITVTEKDKDGNAWTGSAVLNDISETGKTFVYDLHVSGTYAGSWNDAWAYKRFGIQVTENTGFYLWVRDNAVTIRKFTADNKTNCGAECNEEVLVSGDAEATYGWISNAVLNADGTGADLRITRVNDKLNLYVKNADGYQYIGTVTCGEEANSFALYGVTAEFTFSGFEVTALTHVDEKAPSATEAGYFEHYYTGTGSDKVYYDANGKLTIWDKLERPAVLETVVITLQAKKDGQTAAFDGATVKVDGEDVAVTGGKITLENIEPNTEFVITAGDYTGTLKVTAATANVVLEYNFATASGSVDLSGMNNADHVIKITGSGCPSDGAPWSGYATINMENTTADTVFDFTVKDTNVRGGGFDWASRRIAIQVAGNNGFFIWFNSTDEVMIRHLIDSNVGASGSGQGGAYEGPEINHNHGFMKTKVEGADGLHLRIARIGTKIVLNAYNGTEWVYIGETTCAADATNGLTVYSEGDDYEFSGFEVTALTHVDATTDTAEHYYTGENTDKVYYDANGKLTTLDKLAITA